MSFLLDRWLGVAELDESSYERTEGIIRNYLKPTFGDLKAGKLTAEMLELFYAPLRQCEEQCEGRRNGKADPTTKQKHLCEPLAPNTIRKVVGRSPTNASRSNCPSCSTSCSTPIVRTCACSACCS